MNKLIIAVLTVGLTAATHAAAVNWTSNNMSFTDADGKAIATTELNGYTLVLVNLGDSINWDNASVIPTGSASEQTTVNINTATGSKRGRVTGTVGFAYNPDNTGGNLINNGDYLAIMLQDGEGNLSKLTYSASGDEVGNEAVWQVSGLVNNSTSIPANTAKIGLSGNFTAAVPEPTSALLMLLGVAGLALRRRRA